MIQRRTQLVERFSDEDCEPQVKRGRIAADGKDDGAATTLVLYADANCVRMLRMLSFRLLMCS
jgi:hypothetical protein